MYKVKTINNISAKGLDRFSRERFQLSGDLPNPDAILVRSQKLTTNDITPALRAVGRAGAGVNIFPVPNKPTRVSLSSIHHVPTPMPSRSWSWQACCYPSGA